MIATDAYELVTTPPSLEEYLGLRRDSGLSPKTVEQGAGALAGSWYFCHMRSTSTGEAAAMGRIIGDGGWYFHVADMATLPAHQRQGLGRLILDHLLDRIRMEAPPRAYVTLIADAPGRRLYETVGFRESAPVGLGMQLILES